MYIERVTHSSAPDPYLQIGPKKKVKDPRPFSQKFAEILKYSPTRRPRTPGGGFLQTRKKPSPFPQEPRTKSVLSSPATQAQRVKVQESRGRAHSVPKIREQRRRFRIN